MGYNSKSKIIPINSKDFSAVADRPLNSRLDNSKVFNIFGIKLPNWEDSFNNFFIKLQIISKRITFLSTWI